MTNNKAWEILAPAGSIEQLKAAVNNGCDAVYLGLDCFNARMKAPNFTKDNIGKWIDYCHFFNVKVYVTVNTSIKNDEFERAWQAIMTAYRNRADGVIVTDLALIKLAAGLPKPFDIVASTQLNIHDYYGASFIRELGATTVVCSRECSYEQIRDISRAGLKVECFLHGALCVCQSGQCLFSSIVGGNSGNRGLCAQPCRKYYKANFNDAKGYLLSARDICSLDTAQNLCDTGVTTFKIEGRNRRAEYAGAASSVYSKLFNKGFCATKNDYNILAEMFNRGLSSNNYLNGGNSDIIYPRMPNHEGVKIGITKDNAVESEVYLEKGDGLKVFHNGKEICGGIALESGTGRVRVSFGSKVKDGMHVYRTTSQELCRNVLEAKKFINIAIEFTAKIGKKATLIAYANDVTVAVESDCVIEEAVSTPLTSDQIKQQLSKIGDFQYNITDIVVDVGNIFMAKSQINEMRRKVFGLMQDAIIAQYNRRFDSRKAFTEPLLTASEKRCADATLAVTCYEKKQIASVANKISIIVYKPEIFDKDSFDVDAGNSKLFIDLPSFADMDYVKGLLEERRSGIVCHNVGHTYMARMLRVPYIAGSGLNVFNDYIAGIFSDAETFVYSYELSLAEISEFKNKSGLVFVDGQIVLMQLVHCPFKLVFGNDCKTCKANNRLKYADEMGNEFKIYRRRDTKCSFNLINGNKLSVASKLRDRGRYLVDYDDGVIQHYSRINNGEHSNYSEKLTYTKGRLYSKIY